MINQNQESDLQFYLLNNDVSTKDATKTKQFSTNRTIFGKWNK